MIGHFGDVRGPFWVQSGYGVLHVPSGSRISILRTRGTALINLA